MTNLKISILAVILALSYASSAQDGGAIFVVESGDKGFLPPRMDSDGRDAIVNPSEGLMIYDTVRNAPYYYDGDDWVAQDIVTGNTGSNQFISIRDPFIGISFIIAISDNEPRLGEITMYGGTSAPTGWAFCEGQLLPISNNQTLFALLGTAFGGNGTTTFSLPDLRSRSPIGVGNGPGLSTIDRGEKGGVENKSLTVQNLPSHNHSMTKN